MRVTIFTCFGLFYGGDSLRTAQRIEIQQLK